MTSTLKTGPPKLQLLADLAVITLLLALIPSMAWVIMMAPPVPRDVPSYIIAGVTAVATVFTSIVKGRVQHGLMRGLEEQLRSIGDTPELETPSKRSVCCMPCWKKPQPSQQEILDTKWRAILEINGIKEKFLSTKRFFLIYLPCALLTTAIVAAFTPNAGSQTIDYRPLVPGSYYSHNFTGESKACAGQGDNDRVPAPGNMRWRLENDEYFFVRFEKDCPANRIISHVFNVNSERPDKYAYVDAGVAVDRSAMGASAHLFRGTAFLKLSEKYGRFLKNTTQCVPVMTSNPFTCRKGGGKLERDLNDTQDRYLHFTLDEGKEMGVGVRAAGYTRNLSDSSAMLNYLASDSRNHTVGQGVVYFSAYNDPKGITPFAKDLARTINDPNKDAGTGGSETYVVTCRANPVKSFEYRLVTLSLQAGGEIENSQGTNGTGLAYGRRLTGGEACIPVEETVSNIHFATTIASHYHMVMQNYGLDGYFTTIHRVAGEDRGPPYAFNNSRNGLEDTLGVISAIGVSNIDLGDEPVVADVMGGGKAKAVIEINRLGGNPLVLISLIPPIISIIILVYFFVSSFKQNRHPGGGVVCGERPEMYAAESIRELISLGKPVTVSVHVSEQELFIK